MLFTESDELLVATLEITQTEDIAENGLPRSEVQVWKEFISGPVIPFMTVPTKVEVDDSFSQDENSDSGIPDSVRHGIFMSFNWVTLQNLSKCPKNQPLLLLMPHKYFSARESKESAIA